MIGYELPTPNTHCNETKPYKRDNVDQVRLLFISCALLLRDTYDAFRHGDGVFRSLSFLMFKIIEHTSCGCGNNEPCVKTISSEKEAHGYKWNCSVVSMVD